MLVWLLTVALEVSAQKLPPPSRTVYKCEVEGKTQYSDAPCLGAKKVDVEPTRGLNASSGRERVGRDVQNERVDDIFTEALRPITGKDGAQRKIDAKRFKLSPEAQRECRFLDRAVPDHEQLERQASSETLTSAQTKLLKLRERAHLLGC